MMMQKFLRLKKLSKSLAELERFQRHEIARIRIAIELKCAEREEYYRSAARIADLLPGSGLLFRRVEEASRRISVLEKRHGDMRRRLLKTKALLKLVAARMDRLEAQLDRRELDRSLESHVLLNVSLQKLARRG
jgi:hypothetical protein